MDVTRDRRGCGGTRVVPVPGARRAARLAAAMYLIAAATVVAVPPFTGDIMRDAGADHAVAAATATSGLALLAVAQSVDRLLHVLPELIHFFLGLATALITANLYYLGSPLFDVVAVFYVQTSVFAFYLLRRWWAVAHVAAIGAGYAFVLATATVQSGAVIRWVLVMVGVGSVGAAFGTSWERADRLAGTLATLNASLEARVAEQVEETVRLARLRRFLSPQVADAVVDTGGDQMLRPHRRQIAVLFCDLRGFTRFVGGAEPEDVVEVLDSYYEVLGRLVRQYGATVGTLAGDGVMLYFNDPVPCDDPPGRALELALALREPLAGVIERWRAVGFDLGYGVGIAYGYGTLGTIGFEDRLDYTAVGSVVNLAARLCDEAGSGEVLLDERAYDAVRDRVSAERCTVSAKGFPEPVTAYRVGRLPAVAVSS